MSRGEEADDLVRACSLTVADLAAMSLAAPRWSFMPAAVWEQAVTAIEVWSDGEVLAEQR